LKGTIAGVSYLRTVAQLKPNLNTEICKSGPSLALNTHFMAEKLANSFSLHGVSRFHDSIGDRLSCIEYLCTLTYVILVLCYAAVTGIYPILEATPPTLTAQV